MTNLPISICAIQWFTPINGILYIYDNVLATIHPIDNGPAIPGPFVYAIKCIFYIFKLDSFNDY